MKVPAFAFASLLLTLPLPAQTRTFLVQEDGRASVFLPLKGAPLANPPQAAHAPAAQLLVGGSDDCATAEPIAGAGSFAFDNSAATTGTNGQLNAPACTAFNLTALAKDVWFLWTAPAAGDVQLSTCGQTTVDTKVAVYDWTAIGSTCPPSGAGSTVLACNDDLNAISRQSKVAFTAAAGNLYLIQLGSFPGGTPVGGLGSFTLDYMPNAPQAPCVWDDNDAELVHRLVGTAGAEICWMNRFGLPGQETDVSAILATWGDLFNAAASGLTDGYPTRVALWDDPNDDGDPIDAVLVEEVLTVVAGRDTSLFTTVPLSSTHRLSGLYFAGVTIVLPTPLPANWFPIPMDIDRCEPMIGDTAWVAINAVAPLNTANLALNSTPPAVPLLALNNVLTLNLAFRLRTECAPVTAGQAFCAGDGSLSDHTTACPCANDGAPGRGCGHSFDAGGALISASGAPATDDVVLRTSATPASAFTLFMQHDALDDRVFHDGVLCAGGTLIRLRGRNAVAGQAFFPNSAFPNDATLTLSQRGGVVPGSGARRYYAGWFRNASTTFCPPATANVTNGFQIDW